MTSRAALHALIDTLPDDALATAEARLRALEPPSEAAPNGVDRVIPRDSHGPDSADSELSAEERQRFEEAAARGDALAWAILHAQPLGAEFNSERPHDLSRSNQWFRDDPVE